MSRVFTDYLRALEPGGAPPDRERFEALWRALRGVLAGEMRRRSVWSSPPSYLGVYGWSRWTETGIHDGGPDDALEELLSECYAFIFIQRLRCLRAQLQVRSNVDGLVFLNVRNFLHDTQKKHDPLGFRVFEMLQVASREMVAAGELHVLEGDPRVRNETVFAFQEGCDPSEAEAADLEPRVRAWNDDLLPDLVTARGRRLARTLGALREKIADLRSLGVRAFRFKDLIDPLKADVRGRWGALLEQADGAPAFDDGPLPSLVHYVRPDTSLEERERFLQLVACVDEALEHVGADESTREYLLRLWGFLRAHAHGEQPELPSRRRLAAALGIPRDRLAGLYERIGDLLQDCREVDSQPVEMWPPSRGQSAAEQREVGP